MSPNLQGGTIIRVYLLSGLHQGLISTPAEKEEGGWAHIILSEPPSRVLPQRTEEEIGSSRGLHPDPSEPAHIEEKDHEQVTGTKKTYLSINQRTCLVSYPPRLGHTAE